MLAVLGIALVTFALVGFCALWLSKPFAWDHAAHAYVSWLLWSVAGVGCVLSATALHG